MAYMAYSMNPELPKVRREAVWLVKQKGWSVRKVARHFGYTHSAIVKWCAKDPTGGWRRIETRSSRPKRSPRALPRAIVSAIIRERIGRRRCAEHVYHALLKQGVEVSLSSVKRTLDRCHLRKKRSPWKRPHDFTPRPEAAFCGALLELDTIHIIAPDGSRIYVYTIIDLFSRWAYAEVVEKIGAHPSAAFARRAQRAAPFSFVMVQTDHGSEFSTRFTHRLLQGIFITGTAACDKKTIKHTLSDLIVRSRRNASIGSNTVFARSKRHSPHTCAGTTPSARTSRLECSHHCDILSVI